MTTPAIVTFDGVSFRYPSVERRGRRFAVEDVSFALRRGEILGVIGPNSAGKTTLLRLLTKVLSPAAGDIRLDGVSLRELGPVDVARTIAVVPQALPAAFPFTVRELVLMGRYPHGPGRFFESDEDRRIAREAIALTGLEPIADVRADRLSGGERQRAVIARALAQRPSLLALDEPTAHLDLQYQALCAELLRALSRRDGVSVLLISHDLNLAAELCDRLLLLADGRVLALGAPEDVLEPARLEAAFGCSIVVETSRVSGCPTVRVAWTDSQASRGGERRISL